MPTFRDILVYYIDHNFALIIITIGFFILYFNRNSRLRQHTKFLLTNLIITFILSIVTTLEINFGKGGTGSLTHYYIEDICNYIGYALRPLIIYLMILAFKGKSKKSAWLLAIPLFLNWIIIGLDPFLHWMFKFNDQNEFVRGYMGFTTHIVSLFYLIFFAIILVKLFKTDDKQEAFAALFMILAVIVATILETADLAYDILNTAVAGAILFYYVFMFTFFKKRDTLTGLLDRHTFYVDYETYKKHITGLIAMDLNGLKEINDKKGHKKGDEALIDVSRIFASERIDSLRFYRLGGDEFEAIAIGLNEVEIKQHIASLRTKFKDSPYECSFGYAFKESEDTVDTLLMKADVEMYNDKRNYYANKNDRRSKSYKYTQQDLEDNY